MELQQQISREKLEKYIGSEIEVLIESETFDNRYYVGRSRMDVVDVDGVVYIEATASDLLNKFVNCKVIGVKEYDLIAELI